MNVGMGFLDGRMPCVQIPFTIEVFVTLTYWQALDCFPICFAFYPKFLDPCTFCLIANHTQQYNLIVRRSNHYSFNSIRFSVSQIITNWFFPMNELPFFHLLDPLILLVAKQALKVKSLALIHLGRSTFSPVSSIPHSLFL